jgi:DNA-binding response OmpR family regulator
MVEDDPVTADVTEALLRLSGLRNPIRHLTDGEAAAAWLDQRLEGDEAPVLLLLDLHLPGRSGLEILRWLRPRAPHLPVIMLTAAADLTEVNEAYDLGIASYLVKPVGADAVAEIVRGLDMPWALLPPDAAATADPG